MRARLPLPRSQRPLASVDAVLRSRGHTTKLGDGSCNGHPRSRAGFVPCAPKRSDALLRDGRRLGALGRDQQLGGAPEVQLVHEVNRRPRLRDETTRDAYSVASRYDPQRRCPCSPSSCVHVSSTGCATAGSASITSRKVTPAPSKAWRCSTANRPSSRATETMRSRFAGGTPCDQDRTACGADGDAGPRGSCRLCGSPIRQRPMGGDAFRLSDRRRTACGRR
jgi:hypothetical protein